MGTEQIMLLALDIIVLNEWVNRV